MAKRTGDRTKLSAFDESVVKHACKQTSRVVKAKGFDMQDLKERERKRERERGREGGRGREREGKRETESMRER